MAYDEALAARVRELLSDRDDYAERKMFGGLCFMIAGHMCCGITSEALMLRVGKEMHETVLARKYARPMDFTGRPMTGMVYVDMAGLKTRAALARWMQFGLDYATSLPPKTARSRLKSVVGAKKKKSTSKKRRD